MDFNKKAELTLHEELSNLPDTPLETPEDIKERQNIIIGIIHKHLVGKEKWNHGKPPRMSLSKEYSELYGYAVVKTRVEIDNKLVCQVITDMTIIVDVTVRVEFAEEVDDYTKQKWWDNDVK